MSDFVQTMKEWRRMCDKHTCSRNKFEFTGLPICPIAAKHEGYPCDEDPIYWTEKATKQLEEIVTKWAAEHPEPVYPTWAEWLESTGLTKHKTGQFCVHMPNQYSYEVKEVEILNEAAYKPIPAGIAEKLGIEPKEGKV